MFMFIQLADDTGWNGKRNRRDNGGGGERQWKKRRLHSRSSPIALPGHNFSITAALPTSIFIQMTIERSLHKQNHCLYFSIRIHNNNIRPSAGTTYNANAANVMNIEHYAQCTRTVQPHVIENLILTGRGEHFHIGFHFAKIMWMMDWNFDYAPYTMKTKPKKSRRPDSSPKAFGRTMPLYALLHWSGYGLYVCAKGEKTTAFSVHWIDIEMAQSLKGHWWEIV